MARAVIRGPDGILSGVRRPLASNLTFVPPTSTTRIFTVAYNREKREERGERRAQSTKHEARSTKHEARNTKHEARSPQPTAQMRRLTALAIACASCVSVTRVLTGE